MKTPKQINAERKKEGHPPLNFALFRKVINKLETAPEAYSQDSFGRRSQDAPCGTAACIAGWAVVLDGEYTPQSLTRAAQRRPSVVSEKARRSLGLNYSEADTLFTGSPSDGGGWPGYGERFSRANTPKQAAKVAISYLKHIIKTGKVLG